jgi:NADH-quinone oxidoreductase subunit A
MNLAFYCLLFTAVGVGFILVHLILGKVVRPNRPGAEKGTTYECGEPTIGSAWIQFDLRFYVVALLFVIFDVEVAFFFPWAEVFGRANDVAALARPTEIGADGVKRLKPLDAAGYRDYCQKVLALAPARSQRPSLRAAYQTLANMTDLSQFDHYQAERDLVEVDLAGDRTIHDAGALAWMAFLDILVFFGVLLVGFAYLWRRGDLAWVRSVAAEQAVGPAPPPAPEPPRAVERPRPEPVVSAH